MVSDGDVQKRKMRDNNSVDEYDPGGDELGAIEWSLSPEESEGLGPRGASSETGRRCGRFLSALQIESGPGQWRLTETMHSGRAAPFVHPHYSTGARWAQRGEPQLLLRGGDASTHFSACAKVSDADTKPGVGHI